MAAISPTECDSISWKIAVWCKQTAGGITLWLDLATSLQLVLGQNYHELARYSSTLKHFPYHKLGGGADVQRLINHFAHDSESQKAFIAFKRLFELPYDNPYETFKQQGFLFLCCWTK